MRWFQRISSMVSKVSQYEPIEVAKESVRQADSAFAKCKDILKASNENYALALKKKSSIQQNINTLLYKKPNWTPNEVALFTQLCQEELTAESSVQLCKKEYSIAEAKLESAHHNYMNALRKHYSEEQVWIEQSRRISVYFSLGLFLLNSGLFLISIYVVEPRKRQKVLQGVKDIIDKESETISNHLDSRITKFIQRFDSADIGHRSQQELEIKLLAEKQDEENSDTKLAIQYFSICGTLILLIGLLK